MTIRVVLVDDTREIHDFVAALCRASHDILLVGHGYDGESALGLCRSLLPNVVLIDVVMPGIGGVEAALQVVEAFPAVKVLALSSFHEYEVIRQMLSAGAVGYIVKTALVTDLIPAIHAAQSGSTVLSHDATTALLAGGDKPAHAEFNLTSREREVLTQMGQGLTDGQIAHNLEVSASTVRFHLKNILGKMKAGSRSQMLVTAARHRLI